MIRELLIRASPRTWLHHYTSIHSVRGALLLLFVLTTIANASYLHRVPGLLGDEASEGENVFELLAADTLTIRGERSYIGVWIDYARIPFFGVFGASTLALRIPMLLVSLGAFVCGWIVFRRLFGVEVTPYALAAVFFSPAYLLYQRLGWAITLIPFFALLTLAFLTSKRRHAPLLAGLSAGVGLSAHILFLATLPVLLLAWVLQTSSVALRQAQSHPTARRLWFTMSGARARAVEWWPAVVGFWAGFGTQFAVLFSSRDDQGDPLAVAESVRERLEALPSVLPLVLSGSSYVARYTGVEFPREAIFLLTFLLAGLAIVALGIGPRRATVWAWALGLVVHLGALLVFIDRFTLRYFVVLVLGVWLLAGVGLGTVFLQLRSLPFVVRSFAPVGLALLLILGAGTTTLLPFLQTGGSTADFSLGNRADSAAAFVDARPLRACLRGAGPVFSENVHIQNRLTFLAHGADDLLVAHDEDDARWRVDYRTATTPIRSDERCPALAHFRVTPAH